MAGLPPLPPGFTLDTPQQPSGVMTVGTPRPPAPPKPDLPQGYQLGPDGIARPVPGLPSEFTNPKTAKAEPPSGYRFTPSGGLEAIPGGPADKTGEGTGDIKVSQRIANLDSLSNQIKRVESLYSSGFKNQGLKSPLEYLPGALSDKVAQFNAATAGLAEQGLAAFRVPGVGSQSDTELRQFVEANRPRASDRDSAIEEKLLQLRNRVDATRAHLGLPPVDWKAPLEADDNNKDDAAPPAAGDTPSGGNEPPPSPNLTPSTDGTRSVIDPKLQSLAGKLGGLIAKGADFNKVMGTAVGIDPTLRNDPAFRASVEKAIAERSKPEVQRYIKEKGTYPFDPSFYTRQVPLAPAEQLLNQAAQSDLGAAAASAGNAASFGLLDEAVGAMGGDPQRAQMTKEFLRREHPLSSLAGELGGGIVGLKGLTAIPKLGESALATDLLYGGGYGAGESNDNRLGGAAVGAGTAFAGNKLANYLGDLAATARAAKQAQRAEGRDILDAGQRQGIDVLPADVGGTFTKKLTAAAAQGPVSAVPVVRAAQRMTDQAAAARDRLASSVGQALEPEAAGELAKQGAENFISRTSQRGGRLYDRAASLAGDTKVPLPKAIETLDRNIAELSEIPGGASGLDALNALRSQLEGEFTVQGIRGMRTALRDEFVKDGLIGSDLQRRVNQVIDAATEDVANGLRAQGKGNAAGVYKAADRYWRARLEKIDGTLRPIIGAKGEKSGEEVMAALDRAAKGNNARLSSFMGALEPEEQANVRATVISRLGRASNGTQNAAGDAFSLPQFLTHWNALSPGAKRTMFQGETRAALDDLAKVAEGAKEAQKYQNFSNTAGGITGQMIITGLPLYSGGLLGAAASMLSQYSAGRLLASPRFAKWLAGAATTANPKAHIEKLAKIAGAEAPIAAELTGLRKALLSASNDNPVTAPVAAESQSDDRRQ